MLARIKRSISIRSSYHLTHAEQPNFLAWITDPLLRICAWSLATLIVAHLATVILCHAQELQGVIAFTVTCFGSLTTIATLACAYWTFGSCQKALRAYRNTWLPGRIHTLREKLSYEEDQKSLRQYGVNINVTYTRLIDLVNYRKELVAGNHIGRRRLDEIICIHRELEQLLRLKRRAG